MIHTVSPNIYSAIKLAAHKLDSIHLDCLAGI